jgi:hypothetical protein
MLTLLGLLILPRFASARGGDYINVIGMSVKVVMNLKESIFD